MYATGLYAKEQVRARINGKGLRTKLTTSPSATSNVLTKCFAIRAKCRASLNVQEVGYVGKGQLLTPSCLRRHSSAYRTCFKDVVRQSQPTNVIARISLCDISSCVGTARGL